jgi:hypothetical protein
LLLKIESFEDYLISFGALGKFNVYNDTI